MAAEHPPTAGPAENFLGRGPREHSCPGCSAVVPDHIFACRNCWRILPRDMKQGIMRTRHLSLLSVERLEVVTKAVRYLSEKLGTTGPEWLQLLQTFDHPVEDHLRFEVDRG